MTKEEIESIGLSALSNEIQQITSLESVCNVRLGTSAEGWGSSLCGSSVYLADIVNKGTVMKGGIGVGADGKAVVSSEEGCL